MEQINVTQEKATVANAVRDLRNLDKIIPDKDHREGFLYLVSHLEADRTAMVLLKGHLVIEEKLTESIGKSVFHPNYLDGARLTFAQKLVIRRSLSSREGDNSIWDLIEKINRLRNRLSHSLDRKQLNSTMQALRVTYTAIVGGKLENWEEEDEASLVAGAIAVCLGFLISFMQEIHFYSNFVNRMRRYNDSYQANHSPRRVDTKV